MNHFTNPSFWACYGKLPSSIQKLADKNFSLLKGNSSHPSLKIKKVKQYWSVRIGKKYRTLGIEADEGIIWFWIGKHSEYDRLIQK